jgi:deoxyribose-phosphate aldolase
MDNLSSYIDHTLLGATASETNIRKICEEAWIHQFKAVCVAPVYVPYVVEMLEFCPVKIEIATVIGFPMGYSTAATKIFEAREALQNGATELDVVMNRFAFQIHGIPERPRRTHDRSQTLRTGNNGLLKVIIETAYLDSFDLYTACEICAEANVDFVKTSTGFAPKGAEVETVKTMRSILPTHIKIKASGGIRTYDQAIAMIEAGADRIGTSAGVSIVTQA